VTGSGRLVIRVIVTGLLVLGTAAASTAATATSGLGSLRPAIEHCGTTLRPQARNKFGINRMLSIGHIRGF